jgi:serine/threonine protein kinase
MDFGIAKGATDRKLTMTGTTMGSLYYMSPEQIRGVQTLDSRSDLYSLGVTLYELLTGKRPFDGDSQFAIMSAHLEKTPVPPISIDPRLPQALNDLILFSVNREPEGRFQNAGAFQKALQSVTGKPAAPAVVAAPVPTPQPAPKPVAASPSHAPATAGGSRRWLWAAIGGLACVAALVAVIQFGPKKNADAGTSPAPPPAATNPAPEASPAAGTVPSASPASSVPAEAVPPAASPKTIPAPQVQKGARDSSHSAPQSQAVSTTPASAVPQTVTAPQQAVPQPVDPRPSAPPPAQPDTSAKRAELMKLRESAALVSARAVSIHTTLQNMQRSQAASGLGMRSDWVQSATMMDTFLRASNDALAAGDTEAAKDYIDKAERQVEKLEKALNK